MASPLVYAKDAMPSKQSKWHHLYNTPRWKRRRVVYLSDPAHMFCVMCKEAGRYVLALDYIYNTNYMLRSLFDSLRYHSRVFVV